MNRWIAGMMSGLLTAAVIPVAPVSAVSSQVIGYGQGTAVDSENRPLDALAFDEQYAEYDAYATTPDRSRIILTFDQGYENGYTAQILDTLQEKNVSAIFFLTGDYAKKETELVERMIAEGHVLGNHGMTHASLPTLSESEAKAEIMDLHQYVLDTYDYEMQYFRCPCGEYSEAALDTAQECGYRTLFWSDAYVDWKTDAQPDPAQSLERLEEHAHGGEILLLHSVSSTNAEILGDLIDALRADGYTL
ncbi:MAG: polysaccharide deacetylase family protein [Ruminococcus sp.]